MLELPREKSFNFQTFHVKTFNVKKFDFGTFNFHNCHLKIVGVGIATRGAGEGGQFEKEANMLQHLLGTLSHR